MIAAAVTAVLLYAPPASATGGANCDVEVELECESSECQPPYSGTVVSSETLSSYNGGRCPGVGTSVEVPGEQTAYLAKDGSVVRYNYSWKCGFDCTDNWRLQTTIVGCNSVSSTPSPYTLLLVMLGALALRHRRI